MSEKYPCQMQCILEFCIANSGKFNIALVMTPVAGYSALLTDTQQCN